MTRTRASARRTLRRLCARFGVPDPVLRWNPAATHGQVHWDAPVTVETGPAVLFGFLPVLLHEFAHLLADSRVPGTGDHGPAFARALEDAVSFYGWDDLYPWDKESTSVQMWHEIAKL